MKSPKLAYLLFLCLSLPLLSGCGSLFGLIADMLPKPDIPAEYNMEGKKVLVFANSLSSASISPVFVHTLTNQINGELLKNEAASGVIEYSKISDLMLNTTDVLTAEYAGRQLQADYVLKIEIQQLSIDFRSSENCRVGQMLCFLTVLDAKSGKRLWPEDQLKKSFNMNSRLELNTDDTLSPSQIQRDLAKNAGDKIAKLFYKHKQK